MKISVWHNLPSGGGKRALYYHVRGLVERGHQVEVWCPSSADRDYLPLSQVAPEHVVPLEWRPDRSSGRLNDIIRTYRNVRRGLSAMESHCRRCAEEINRAGFDFHLSGSCRFFAVPPVARFLRGPTALYLGEPCRFLYESSPNFIWAAPPRTARFRLHPRSVKAALKDALKIQALRIQAREEINNAKAFDSVWVNSYYSRESLIRAYGMEARVCYLGIDTGIFVHRHQPRDDVVIGLGAISAHKNPRFVIDAVATITLPRPKIVWIGYRLGNADGFILELKAHAEGLGVDFCVREAVSDTKLVELLNGSRAMVFAPRLEPFGLAPLEASACGLPVVAVAEGGVRETIVDGENGYLIERDPAAAGAAIERLRKDPLLAERLGESARRFVEAKWSLPKAMDRLEGMITALAANGRAQPTADLAL